MSHAIVSIMELPQIEVGYKFVMCGVQGSTLVLINTFAYQCTKSSSLYTCKYNVESIFLKQSLTSKRNIKQ